MAAQRPDAFRPDLAASLNNLANRLSEVGDREAALTAAREAVDLYRALAAQRPDAFRPDLAMSLWVLAGCLDAVGRQQEGLVANTEAIVELSGPFRRHRGAFADRIADMAQGILATLRSAGAGARSAIAGAGGGGPGGAAGRYTDRSRTGRRDLRRCHPRRCVMMDQFDFLTADITYAD